MYGNERANNISRFEQLTNWTIKPRILLPLEGIDLSHARKNITKGGGGGKAGGEGRRVDLPLDFLTRRTMF